MGNMHTVVQRLLYLSKTAKAKRFFYVVMVLLLLGSVYRDITHSAPVPWDFRNRIVGARLMEDGASPYFFIWQPNDSVRYYDRIDPLANVSPATASPFFHWGLSLIADLPQLHLNMLWMAVEYLVLLGTLLIAVLSTSVPARQRLVPILLMLIVAFTYTIGWKVHVLVGQNYIFIPFLLMGCALFINKQVRPGHLLGFGVCCAAVLLVRPVVAILFLPFVFYFTTYFKWGAVAVLILLGYSLFVINNPVQKLNWIEYFKSVPLQMANHQILDEAPLPDSIQLKRSATNLPVLEGVSLQSIDWKPDWRNITLQGECSNLYFIYYKATGKHIPIAVLFKIAWLSCIICLLPLLVARIKQINLPPESLFLIGFATYNLYTFCLPATRQQYNWVEFLFPLLLIVCRVKQVYMVPLILLLVGFYLNIAYLPIIKMRHNLGAFLLTAVFFYLAYRPMIAFYSKEQKVDRQWSWW